MTTTTLFQLPAPIKRKRERGPWTQVERCKRCRGSVHDRHDEGYCHRHDLSLEYVKGDVYLLKDMHKIKCDGEEWGYA